MKIKISILFYLVFGAILLSQSQSSFNGAIRTARMLERQGDIDAAISVYKGILEKKPNHYQTLNSLKNLYKNNQLYNEGIQFLEDRTTKNPDNISINLDLVEFYFLNEQNEESEKIQNVGLQRFNNKSYYRQLTALLIKYGSEDDFVSILNRGRSQFGKSFLAYEAGLYYQVKKDYGSAMNQFMLYILNEEKRSSLIERRILQMSDEKEALGIIKSKLTSFAEKKPRIILNILCDLYFKQQDYLLAIQTKESWTSSGNKDLESWLKFANSLNREKQFQHAAYAYNFILDNTINSKITEKALLGLAKTFEDQILPFNENFLISFFYDDNIFFKYPFASANSISIENLKASLSLYDSLTTSIKNPALLTEVYYRLGEVQFRILHDFDKALKLYTMALKGSTKKSLTSSIKLRIADTYIAKGNPEKAKKFILDSKHEALSSEMQERIILTDLFTKNPDEVLSLIDTILVEIGPKGLLFNDLMELKTILNKYNLNDENNEFSIQHFLKSEFLIRQKKTGDAINELIYLINNYPDSKIAPLANLRISLLNYKIDNFEESLHFALSLKNTEFEDLGIILTAHIYELKLSNTDEALKNYMKIINDFPQSLHFEPVRYHVRKINQGKNI
tara:strand:- start:2207 stop:4069 length:1863 start_codon:yes stop_codon:yes gene_type:complete